MHHISCTYMIKYSFCQLKINGCLFFMLENINRNNQICKHVCVDIKLNFLFLVLDLVLFDWIFWAFFTQIHVIFISEKLLMALRMSQHAQSYAFIWLVIFKIFYSFRSYKCTIEYVFPTCPSWARSFLLKS